MSELSGNFPLAGMLKTIWSLFIALVIICILSNLVLLGNFLVLLGICFIGCQFLPEPLKGLLKNLMLRKAKSFFKKDE